MRPSWPLGLALRLLAVGGAAALLGFLLVETRYFATALIVSATLALLFGELLRYATTSDRDLARVIESLGQGDFIDRPSEGGRFAVDSTLGRAFANALDRLRQRNRDAEGERTRLTAVIAQAPVPLLIVEADGRVELLNRAARRLFAGAEPARRGELAALSPSLDAMLDAPQGGRKLVPLALPRGVERCLVTVSRSISGGRASALLSLQSIQGELEANEVRAWEELVRVLAHEIMNSLTPVASLAQTAQLMVSELDDPQHRAAAASELSEAIDAIQRRSTGLIRFIDGYRRFAEPPTPIRRPTPVAEIFDRARRLASGLAEAAAVRLDSRVEPPGLVLDADPDLIDQALINLVRNAIEAAEGANDAAVTLTATLDERGHAMLEVADTGPGLPDELRERVFVPFFTTKAKGSGIGLSIVRQIMLAHGGTVEALSRDTPPGGAVFRLIF